MTENIVEAGDRYVDDVQHINKSVTEKTLRMRCLAYLAQAKAELLVETIYDMNASRKQMAAISEQLAERNRETERQKEIIQQQSDVLILQNRELEIERDLLELKVDEREEIERQAREVIERSQKMHSLGKLAGGIVHDYNNMLGVISGNAELLDLGLKDQPRLEKYASNIRHACERGAELSKKLLAFSKQQTTSAASISINQQLLDDQQILEKSVTARIRLEYELAPELWQVYLDSGELEDALLNMVINAMHAITGHGEITIRTANTSLDALDAHILQLAAGDYVAVEIEDSGCGIPDSEKDRIFEPFYTTKGESGTGLGLSQVYGFVERSGGAIRVDSAVGKGTRFTLYFPRSRDRQAEAGPLQQQQPVKLEGDETLLVVDDEAALLEVTSELLRSYGYRVLGAGSAAEALEVLQTQPVDLLLTDIIMPNMDGFELAAEVARNYPAVKIQLASGFSDSRHSSYVNDRLQSNILDKPYSPDKLLRRVRALLDENRELLD